MEDIEYQKGLRWARHMLDVQDKIDTHGFVVQGVLDNEAGFSWLYTVGLSAAEHPELVVTTADIQGGHRLLNSIGRAVLDDLRGVRAGEDYECGGVVFRAVPITPARTVDEDWFNVLHARRGERSELAMLQMVWPGYTKGGDPDALAYPTVDEPWRDQPLWAPDEDIYWD